MTLRVAACGCVDDTPMGAKRPKVCECGNLFQRPEVEKARAERRTTKLAPEGGGRKSSGAKLRRGRGFAVHPRQREKVKGRPCIVCGADFYETVIDPAHVYPRGLQTCDCPEGVVPLCRNHHHRYDHPEAHLDLLPHLVTHGYHAETVHAVSAHGVPLGLLLEQVTGLRWEPVDARKAAA